MFMVIVFRTSGAGETKHKSAQCPCCHEQKFGNEDPGGFVIEEIHEHTSNDIIFKSQRHWNSLYNNLDYAVADVARFLSLQFCLPTTVLLLLYY